MNRIGIWTTGIVLAGALLVVFASGQDKPKSGADAKGQSPPSSKEESRGPKPDPDQRLEQFRKLAGEWKSKGGEAPMQVQYKVTGAGSVVVETLFPGTPHEMLTVIHYDKDDLVLTHYCALGNQPHMKADAKNAASKEVKFVCVGGTNMQSENDAHMHGVTYTFVDDDHLRSEWVHFEGGKAKGDPVVFEWERVKGAPAAKTAAPAPAPK